MSNHGVLRGPWPVVSRLVGLLILLSSAGANAQEASYVMRDGTPIGLTRSANELGVVFHSAGEIESGRPRVETAGEGELTPFIDDPTCRIKIMRVPRVTAQRRSVVRQDPAVEEVRPVYRFATSPAPMVCSGSLVARVRPWLADAELTALWAQHGLALIESVHGQPNVYRLKPIDDEDEAVARAEGLAGDNRILWAQPNFRRPIEKRQIAVNDALFDQQWHLHNTGQLGGNSDADIDALEAWSIADGQDILIGMFDDACDVQHEDLRDGYIGEGHDPSLPSNNPGFSDPQPKQIGDSHGTRVMGLAVSRGNSRGGRGVAFQSRFTSSRGLAAGLTDAQIASVFTFALQQNVDVHINSWGQAAEAPNPAVIEDAIVLAFEQGRNKGNLDEEEGDDPLGMVVVFASGNASKLNRPGFELSTIPQVLAVGASQDEDERASYSNFAENLDLLAPSGDSFHSGLLTTDNTDRAGAVDQGANIGGVNSEGFEPLDEIDSTGQYTQYFSGTSGACPVAAGVAALVLSVNPLLTVTDVRMIMQHTCDQVNPQVADYDGITSHSLQYGYGRVNANAAAQAALNSSDNGGRSWPSSPASVSVANNQLRFRINEGTDEFLVVQADAAFDFVPEDGLCYSPTQLGCTNADIEPLPSGVTVLAVGCGLRCGADPSTQCELGDDQCVDFLLPSGRKFLGVYARSTLGRYSFGVAADSDGLVRGSGQILRGDVGGGGGGGGGGGVPSQAPAVTIAASPLEGDSPLTVRFSGNAVSELPIDDSRTAWDFDIADTVVVNATSRNATHVYQVAAGETRTFVARLTMYDNAGHPGFEQISILVHGPDSGNGGGIADDDLQIIVGTPDSPNANLSQGRSPFQVLVRVDSGEMDATVQSVVWDLGDGTRQNGLTVPHTYVNTSGTDLRIPITATVSAVTTSGAPVTQVATKLVTILTGDAPTDSGNPDLPGTGVPGSGPPAGCGAFGIIPVLGIALTLGFMKRRRVN